MTQRLVTESNLTAIADEIRAKGGTSEALSFPDGFISAIEAIETGGGGWEEIYSTEFAVDSDLSSGSGTICTISTGLSLDLATDELYFIVFKLVEKSSDSTVSQWIVKQMEQLGWANAKTIVRAFPYGMPVLKNNGSYITQASPYGMFTPLNGIGSGLSTIQINYGAQYVPFIAKGTYSLSICKSGIHLETV